jgi:hypothetical protein
MRKNRGTANYKEVHHDKTRGVSTFEVMNEEDEYKRKENPVL